MDEFRLIGRARADEPTLDRAEWLALLAAHYRAQGEHVEQLERDRAWPYGADVWRSDGSGKLGEDRLVCFIDEHEGPATREHILMAVAAREGVRGASVTVAALAGFDPEAQAQAQASGVERMGAMALWELLHRAEARSRALQQPEPAAAAHDAGRSGSRTAQSSPAGSWYVAVAVALLALAVYHYGLRPRLEAQRQQAIEQRLKWLEQAAQGAGPSVRPELSGPGSAGQPATPVPATAEQGASAAPPPSPPAPARR